MLVLVDIFVIDWAATGVGRWVGVSGVVDGTRHGRG